MCATIARIKVLWYAQRCQSRMRENITCTECKNIQMLFNDISTHVCYFMIFLYSRLNFYNEKMTIYEQIKHYIQDHMQHHILEYQKLVPSLKQILNE